MKLRKRLSNPVLWMTMLMGSMILTMALQAEPTIPVDAGKSILTRCEAKGVEVPAAFVAALNRLESFGSSRMDGSRSYIQQSLSVSGALVFEVIELTWGGTHWINGWKDIITMNDGMTQLFSDVSQVWVNDAWENDSRMVLTYNSQGLIVSMAFDGWQNNAWVPEMLISNFYDGSGNLIEDIMQMDMNYDGVPDNFLRTVYTYTGGLLTKSEEYMWYSAWTRYAETTYAYNGQGQLIEEVLSTDLGYGYSFYTSKIMYTYNGAGDVETETYQDYDIGFSTWTNRTKYSYTYNGQRQETSDLTQTWNGSAWDNSYLHTVTYGGPHGEETVDLWQDWNGSSWVNVDRSTYAYDGNGNETSYLDEIWNGASWENDEKGTTAFNSNNQPVLEIVQVWYGGAWVNDTRYEYTYSGTAVDDSPVIQPEAFTLTNYPNPFNPATMIQFALPAEDQISVTIFDATGRAVKTLIQSESVSAGIHEIQWNGTNAFSQPVASGVYFYTIQGLRFNQTNRCLLLK